MIFQTVREGRKQENCDTEARSPGHGHVSAQGGRIFGVRLAFFQIGP
jgi:hypothetical protein